MGSIKKFIHDVKYEIYSSENLNKIQAEDIDTILENNITTDDMIVATLGHEIDHTRPRNVGKMIIEEKGGNTGRNDSEFTPSRTTNIILKDLGKNKK